MGIGVESQTSTGWGPTGIGMAIITTAQVAAAAFVLVRHVPLGGAQVVAAGGAGIVSIVLLALAPLPRIAKASLTALLCGAGMAVISTQDPLGMRAVNRQMAAAIGKAAPQGAAPADPVPADAPASDGRVTIRTAAASDDQGFAPALAQGIEQRLTDAATDDIRVNGAADVAAAGDPVDLRAAYSVTWSVADRGAPRWCGRIAATMPSRAAAVSGLAVIIARSADRIAKGASACS